MRSNVTKCTKNVAAFAGRTKTATYDRWIHLRWPLLNSLRPKLERFFRAHVTQFDLRQLSFCGDGEAHGHKAIQATSVERPVFVLRTAVHPTDAK